MEHLPVLRLFATPEGDELDVSILMLNVFRRLEQGFRPSILRCATTF